MEPHNLDVMIFSERIRKEMQCASQPLVRFRRRFFKGYADVFSGCDATAWAMKTVHVEESDEASKVGKKNEEKQSTFQFLTEKQVCALYQKLMDAGLLKNVTTQEEFRNDKSLFRFSADDSESEKVVRAVTLGYRLFDSAQCPGCNLFQKVCALGQLVSCECLKSRDMVTWFVKSGLCATREDAVTLGQTMRDCSVIKPVDSEVLEFSDGSSFYMFDIDFKRPRMSVHQFLNRKTVYDQNTSVDNKEASRNKRIHLRQTSDQLMDLSHMALSSPTVQTVDRRKGISTSSSDSGFDEHAVVPSPSYQSLLKSDGSMTKEALMHPSAPFIKKDLWIYPDPVGYGFVIRGSGPCIVKIVDPDSPAGKAGLKASQYITSINGDNVLSVPHTKIEDLILGGPKHLKISVMQHKDFHEEPRKAVPKLAVPPPTPTRQRSSPPLPSAQPWIKNRDVSSYRPPSAIGMRAPPMRQVMSQ